MMNKNIFNRPNKKIMNHTFTKKLKAPTKRGSVSSSSNRYISSSISSTHISKKRIISCGIAIINISIIAIRIKTHCKWIITAIAINSIIIISIYIT